MESASHFVSNNGVRVPTVGLGTWKARPGEVREAVKHALQAGYRHLDCAYIYQNENEVGEGIEDSGIPRSEIFITSKLWSLFHDDVAAGLEKTLQTLQTDYVDLYLIHWPVRLIPNETHPFLPLRPDGTRNVDVEWDQRDTWKQMEAIYRSGKAKAIGLFNFSIPYIEHLKETWTVVPAVNQVELHPYCPAHELKKYCAEQGILLEAYSPLGSSDSPLLGDPELKAIANKYGESPATILISYQVNRGVVVLPKSVSPARIASNLRVIKLEAEDMLAMDGWAAEGKQHRMNKPDWGSDLGFVDWFA